ncbi:hypothetical protein [Actinomyces wuliandei]|uniref:antitoxin VbhA family protein n=1 Tax=Actinomyces wuliandei TaxID=2057743 RepID=UPI001FA9E6A6|nr:hypothetical protein [Actinomyces wuliandei]
MDAEFTPEAWWPDLYAPLSQQERRALTNTLAADWHEGWTPSREDVADLLALRAGTLTRSEYHARALSRAGNPVPASA